MNKELLIITGLLAVSLLTTGEASTIGRNEKGSSDKIELEDNNKISDRGKLTADDRAIYEGKWKSEDNYAGKLKNGNDVEGKLTADNRAIHEGKWKSDSNEDKDGFIYEGEWESNDNTRDRGVSRNRGVLRDNGKITYEGEWKKDSHSKR
jgi:uncharacterized membrane protein YkoI